MAHDSTKRIAVFFTHGVSLEVWEQRGMFSREVKFYQQLAQRIGEVWFFTYGSNDAKYQGRLGDRIRVFPKYLPLPNLLYAMLLPIVYGKQIRRANLIRVHQMAGAIPALMAHWLFRKPLIVRAGFQWYTFARRQSASHIKLAMISLLERLAYRSARMIIHTTQEDADFVAKRYRLNPDKIHVIPNYVDTDLFKPLPVQKEPHSVCFVGRLEPQKNLHSLLEAMHGANAKLILYGEGSQRASLEQAAREYGIDVEFRGRISNEDLPRALNACEVLVLPSLYEGNPKALLEAMACGLPVIGTNVEGITSIITREKMGLICQTNPESIRQAIDKLLNDPALRARIGTDARHAILASCSLARAVQKENSLYTSSTRHPWLFLQKLLLVLFGLGLALLMLEGGLRLAGIRGELYVIDSKSGLLTLMPSTDRKVVKSCFQSTMRTNTLGFHDVEFDAYKPEDTFRIAVIGDSFVEAVQVPTEKTFHKLLENKLNASSHPELPTFQVYAIGLAGNGTLANALYFQEYMPPFQPDLVINVFYPGNDLRNDSADLRAIYQMATGGAGDDPQTIAVYDSSGALDFPIIKERYAQSISAHEGGAIRKIIGQSSVATLLYQTALRIRAIGAQKKIHEPTVAKATEIPVDQYVYLLDEPDAIREAWNLEHQALGALSSIAENNNAAFLLVSIPDSLRIENPLPLETFDVTLPETKLLTIAQQEQFHYFAIGPSLAAAFQEKSVPFFFPCDGHLNEEGHEQVATAIYKFLFSEPELIGAIEPSLQDPH